MAAPASPWWLQAWRAGLSSSMAVVASDLLAWSLTVAAAVWLSARMPGTDASWIVAVAAPVAIALYLAAGLYPGVGIAPVGAASRVAAIHVGVAIAATLAGLLLGLDATSAASVVAACALALPLVVGGRSVARRVGTAQGWWGVPAVRVGFAGGSADVGAAAVAAVALRPSDDERARHAIVRVEHLDVDQLVPLALELGARFWGVLLVPADGGRPVFVPLALQKRAHRWAKRAFDLLMVIPAALVALPIVAAAAVAVIVASPGNPFYAQEREGRGGRSIRVWKLRTMHTDADALLARHLESDAAARSQWQERYKLTDDPRVVPGVGHLLRRSSLDELPQLWNVLRGDMSFVGPRPFPRYHLAAFDDGFVALRRTVTPGITGWWQISDRADADLRRQRELDTHYLLFGSFWFDLRVLLRTPLAVLKARGAH